MNMRSSFKKTSFQQTSWPFEYFILWSVHRSSFKPFTLLCIVHFRILVVRIGVKMIRNSYIIIGIFFHSSVELLFHVIYHLQDLEVPPQLCWPAFRSSPYHISVAKYSHQTQPCPASPQTHIFHGLSHRTYFHFTQLSRNIPPHHHAALYHLFPKDHTPLPLLFIFIFKAKRRFTLANFRHHMKQCNMEHCSIILRAYYLVILAPAGKSWGLGLGGRWRHTFCRRCSQRYKKSVKKTNTPWCQVVCSRESVTWWVHPYFVTGSLNNFRNASDSVHGGLPPRRLGSYSPLWDRCTPRKTPPLSSASPLGTLTLTHPSIYPCR